MQQQMKHTEDPATMMMREMEHLVTATTFKKEDRNFYRVLPT